MLPTYKKKELIKVKDPRVWMFELYNEAKEVVYSLIIDSATGENTVNYAKSGWRDEFMIESFFEYESADDALAWSGKSINTYWFPRDLRRNFHMAERSFESFSNALGDEEATPWEDSNYKKLQRAKQLHDDLLTTYPDLVLPFEPSQETLQELQKLFITEVERIDRDWNWSPNFLVPTPLEFYIDRLVALLETTLEERSEGKLIAAQQLQVEINNLGDDWAPHIKIPKPFEEPPVPDVSKAKEKLVQSLMTDQEWWGTEAAIRFLVDNSKWSGPDRISKIIENPKHWVGGRFHPPLDLFRRSYDDDIVWPTEELQLAVNHPSVLKIGIERYFEQHAEIPNKKMKRYVEVKKTYPRIIEKFENATFEHHHWIYRTFDESDQLLYVGETSHPLLRLRQHAGLSGFQSDNNRKVSTWFPLMTRIHLEPCTNQKEAREKEAQYIREEEPLFNQVHNKFYTSEYGSMFVDKSSYDMPSHNDPRNVGWKTLRHESPALPVSALSLNEFEIRQGIAFDDRSW